MSHQTARLPPHSSVSRASVEVAQVVQTIRLALQTPCSASFLHAKSRKSFFLSSITGIPRTIDLHVIVGVSCSTRMWGKADQHFGRHFQYMKIIEDAQNQFAKRICISKNRSSFSRSSIVQYAMTCSLCGALFVSCRQWTSSDYLTFSVLV